MGDDPQFKHFRGPDGKFESICMTCLLAVGVCLPEEELVTRELEHDCKGSANWMGLPRFEACHQGERNGSSNNY